MISLKSIHSETGVAPMLMTGWRSHIIRLCVSMGIDQTTVKHSKAAEVQIESTPRK